MITLFYVFTDYLIGSRESFLKVARMSDIVLDKSKPDLSIFKVIKAVATPPRKRLFEPEDDIDKELEEEIRKVKDIF